MNFQQMIDQITPEIYQNMKTAIEVGRWPDGRAVTPEQRETSLQAIIAYEIKNVPEEERTGYIESQCKSKSGADAQNTDEEQPITLIEK